MQKSPETKIINRTSVLRLILGWGAFIAVTLLQPIFGDTPTALLLGITLAGIVGVIIVCAFGVVHEAEALAKRLGDPYGTLVLTLSIVIIEVVLIAAVMLGPSNSPTIGRDSVMAVSMIILNLVIGLSILFGALKNGTLASNQTGTSTYLSLLVLLLAIAFVFPAVIGKNGSYLTVQEIPIIVMTVLIYGFFLWQQTTKRAEDFQETTNISASPSDSHTTGTHPGIRTTLATYRTEILARLAILVLTVLPIVLLSHDMAMLVDDALARMNAPVALAGVLIAMIVFLPESLTSIRAGLSGEMQRVNNLCHGALVSTVGLTIPAVLFIGLITEKTVLLAESTANLTLLLVTVLLSLATFSSKRVTAIHGATHLMLFVVYAIALFS